MLKTLLLIALSLPALASASFSQVVDSCFGDGLGRPCKCGNDDTMNPATGGCLNSAGTGAVLSTNGSTGVAENDLQFTLAGGPPGALAVLTSGDNMLGGGIGILGLPVSDGLRCVGGNFKRHGGRALDSFGNRPVAWGAPGSAPLAGIIGQPGFVSGQTRHFQVRYRDDPMLNQCGFGTNTTQAISITFTPTTPVEPCDATAQMACIAAGNQPCTVGINSAACGPPIEPCTIAAQDACIAMNFEPCTVGVGSADCGDFVDPCTPMVLQACIEDEGLCACDSATGECIDNDEVIDTEGNCCLTSELDCTGICFGSMVTGSQGACCLPSEQDCNGDCNGPVGPDCAGTCDGLAITGANGGCCLPIDLDPCGVCGGDGTGTVGCGSGTVCGGLGTCVCDACDCPPPLFGAACSCTELSAVYNGIYQHSFIANIPETLMLTNASLSGEVWIKPTKIGAPIMTRLGGGVQWGFSTGVPGSTTVANQLRMWNGDACSACTLVGNAVIPLNVWSHVAFSWDHTTGQASLYINGVLDKVGAFVPRPVNPGQLLLGLYSTSYFGGNMDDARLWSTARSAAQIAANYDKSLPGLGNPDLVFNHNFQKWRPGDTECVDYSESGNHLVHSLFVEQSVNNAPAPPTQSSDSCPDDCNGVGACACGVCTCFDPTDTSFDCSITGGGGL